MLVVVSAPQDPSCAPLDTEKERDRILQAVDRLYVQQKMEVDFTDDATFETIQSYLNEKDYHIVHFTGHGTEIDGQGFLVLENEDLTARQVDNQAIADLLAGRGIRLVVLSACESADLADKLVRKGCTRSGGHAVFHTGCFCYRICLRLLSGPGQRQSHRSVPD